MSYATRLEDQVDNLEFENEKLRRENRDLKKLEDENEKLRRDLHLALKLLDLTGGSEKIYEFIPSPGSAIRADDRLGRRCRRNLVLRRWRHLGEIILKQEMNK